MSTSENDAPREPQRPMTIEEREAAEVAAMHETDPILVELLNLGKAGGAGFPIGLLLNGMIITGALAPSKVMAEAMDSRRSKIIDMAEAAGGEMPEGWERTREEGRNLSVRGLEEAQAAREAMHEETDAYLTEDRRLDWDILPANLQREIIRERHHSYLDLTQVTICSPAVPGQIIELPVLRVYVARVAAWWVADIDERGNARFELWKPYSERRGSTSPPAHAS